MNKKFHYHIWDIKNFEFIAGEQVLANPDNLRAASALTFLLYSNWIHCTKKWLSNLESAEAMVLMTLHDVLNSLHHHYYYTTIVQGGCFVTTQYHVVQTSQSENLNFYSVWKLNNKTDKREKSPYKKRMNEIVSVSGKCDAVSMDKSNTKIWYQMGWLRVKLPCDHEMITIKASTFKR